MSSDSWGNPVEVVTEEEVRSSYWLRRALMDALPLLIGWALLMAGSGLTATLLGVRAGLEGFSPGVTGVVLSAFYVGFLVGSLITPHTIWRVGHVRVFAGLASLASAAILLHAVRPEPGTWLVLRALSGVCLAGLYIATETWLNGAATNSTRGGLLAVYMVVVTASQGMGQLLFPVADPQGHAAFVLASVLVSVAVVPVSLATVSPPEVPDVARLHMRELWGTAPLAVVGAAVAGFSGAAIIGGGGAVYASAAGLSRAETSALLFAALVGALVLQIPFGRWSDATDRRTVLIGSGVLGTTAAAVAAGIPAEHTLALVMLATLVGGTSFVLYALANAHLNDYLEPERVIGGGAAMVLVYGVGAVTGPVVVSSGIGIAGPEALFILVAASYAVVALYAAWRLTIRPDVPDEQRSTYWPVTVGTAPTMATLAEATPQAFYPDPIEEEVLSTDRGDVIYRTQGTGTPVILLGNAPDDGSWDNLLAALAVNGAQAIGVELRSEVREDDRSRRDLLAVLRDMELPSATFVGLEAGAVQVAEFAYSHPDRTDAVVFAGSALPVTAEETELEGRALLVLTEDAELPYWDEPELLADAVIDFVRRSPTAATGT